MEPKQRVCLGCGKEFLSESSGNRICRECKRANNKMFVMKTTPFVSRRKGVATSE